MTEAGDELDISTSECVTALAAMAFIAVVLVVLSPVLVPVLGVSALVK